MGIIHIIQFINFSYFWICIYIYFNKTNIIIFVFLCNILLNFVIIINYFIIIFLKHEIPWKIIIYGIIIYCNNTINTLVIFIKIQDRNLSSIYYIFDVVHQKMAVYTMYYFIFTCTITYMIFQKVCYRSYWA